ncbi:DUF805 domain-containing protein [Lacinutrix salivirga]
MNWYLKVIRDNYANFTGRARRQEYWMFTLFHIIFIVSLAFVGAYVAEFNDSGIGFIPLGLYMLATFIPALALASRRLHDIGKTGWYYLVRFIPYIGGIWFLILMVQNGNVGPNQYGPDPKGNNFDEINDIGKPLLD